MDVVHGINLDTSHSMADIEQGQTAIFSITITNTGNVFDRFLFWDPYTLEGQQEWLLAVQLGRQLPNQRRTRSWSVSDQEPRSAGPDFGRSGRVRHLSQGLVRRRTDQVHREGNLRRPRTGYLRFDPLHWQHRHGDLRHQRIRRPWPECVTYPIDVTKNFDSGNLVFTTPGAPEAKPDTISLDAWRQENWVVNLDFSNAPGGNSVPMETPRAWNIPNGDDYVTYEVGVEVCAPTLASAGLGPAVVLKAYLDGYPRISASQILSTNVNHVYSLGAEAEIE